MLQEDFPNMVTVLKFKQARNSPYCFSLKLVTIDICKKILALDASKATQSNDMSIKLIKLILLFFLIF